MKEIAYIEIQVRDLQKSVEYFHRTFQFQVIAECYSDLKSMVLIEAGSIRVLLMHDVSTNPESFNGVKSHEYIARNVVFLTDDIDQLYRRAIQNGAESIASPAIFRQDKNEIKKMTVISPEGLLHTFIEIIKGEDYFIPELKYLNKGPFSKEGSDLSGYDHFAVCVYTGDLDQSVNYYNDTYRCRSSYEEYIVTPSTGMNSKVVETYTGQAKIVFVEPVAGKRLSQVAEYLDCFNGPCIQHIAFHTDNIVETVRKMRAAGVEFLSIPASYYEKQQKRVKIDAKKFSDLRDQSVLIDQQESGYLYQIFTKPIGEYPSLFFEIIQRENCSGFAKGNIQALFEAIEEEQVSNVEDNI